MNELDDKELRNFFRDQFEDFEVQPLTSWPELNSKINPPNRKWRKPVLLCISILIISLIDIGNEFPDGILKQKINHLKPENSSQEIVMPNATSFFIEKEVNDSDASMTVSTRSKVNLSLSQGKTKQDDLANDKLTIGEYMDRDTPNLGVLVLDSLLINRVGWKINLLPFNALQVHAFSKNDLLKDGRIEWVGSVLASFNAGYFQPLSFDNTQVNRFLQSKKFFENRFGLSLSLKGRSSLKNGLVLEGFAGFSYLKKDFTYSASKLTSEGRISRFEKKVDGSALTGLIGGSVYLKKRTFPRTILISIAYQKTFSTSGGLFHYFSDHQIKFGLGVPFSINKKFEFTPQMSYLIPIRRNFVDFQMNTISWGFEIGRKLN